MHFKYKSLAQWPAGTVYVGNTDNITEDFHYSETEAKGVCRALEKTGFGGDGKIFPVKTWTEKVEDKKL